MIDKEFVIFSMFEISKESSAAILKDFFAGNGISNSIIENYTQNSTTMYPYSFISTVNLLSLTLM